jgi:hypothetical protein
MSRRWRYVLIALVLQLLMVLVGAVFSFGLPLAGLFGMGIPLIAGWLYSVRQGLSFGGASFGGILIGAVGAVVALIVAIPLHGYAWKLLPLGFVASSFTGWLGAFVGWLLQKTGKPLTG